MLTVDEFTDQYAPSDHLGEFLYHVTTDDRLPPILDGGLDPSASRLRWCPGELALKVLSDHSERDDFTLVSGDHPIPFDRRESVYAWPSLPMDDVFDGGVIIVIRTADVDARMFLGDHDLIDGIIMDAPTTRALNEGDFEAVDARWADLLPPVITYLHTATVVETAEAIREFNDIYNPEVVIEGGVPPEAFEAVLAPDNDENRDRYETAVRTHI